MPMRQTDFPYDNFSPSLQQSRKRESCRRKLIRPSPVSDYTLLEWVETLAAKRRRKSTRAEIYFLFIYSMRSRAMHRADHLRSYR